MKLNLELSFSTPWDLLKLSAWNQLGNAVRYRVITSLANMAYLKQENMWKDLILPLLNLTAMPSLVLSVEEDIPVKQD